MDSWSYGTSLFLPNGTSLLPCDSFPENPRSIAEFELDKDDGVSAVPITKVASSSCVAPSSLLHFEEESMSSSSKLSRIDFKFRSLMDYGNYDGTSSPAKKTRASSSCSQNPLCQVYGCNMDLSSSKDYYKRHRVCEAHSKTSVVIVNGIEQRFCQQCSRFHFLSEFDNGKRSCRRRLACHNERRRKPSFYFLPGKQRHKLLPQESSFPGSFFYRVMEAHDDHHDHASRLVSFKDEPMLPPAQNMSYSPEASGVSSIWDLHEAAPPGSSACAHSLLSAQSQQHLSESPNKSFSITQPNQSLSHSTVRLSSDATTFEDRSWQYQRIFRESSNNR